MSDTPPFARNVLGGELRLCGLEPRTGYLRDGHCRTRQDDRGLHVVCARVTEAFLQHSLSAGNDLVTPRPEYDFPGLAEGDRWCLCALRWRGAKEAGVAPPLYLQATHERALEVVDLDLLLPHALDLPRNG